MRPPDIWTRRDPVSRLAVTLLTPFGWLYGASVAFRAKHTKQYRSRIGVVCIGNLTSGGTGKTPVAQEIARILIARGARPVFLSRGYGGKARGPAFVTSSAIASDVGDEPLLHVSISPVIISPNRAAGAKLAEESGFDIIIMDDGYQNFSLAKDLTFVVVDAESGFGNNHVLPAGPLREPVAQGMQRADAIILNGDGMPPELSGFDKPLIRSHVAPTADDSWSGRRVIAFAGIGQPPKFFSSLSKIGAQIIEARAYGDHHAYSASEISRLKARARAENALLVTTEKDAVRLTRAQRQQILTLPVRAKFDDLESLERLLDRLVPRALPPQSQ